MSQATIGGRVRRGASKGAAVYDDLRMAIIGLRLTPGARIDKAEICARLGVSRQPLAEAIARLAEERLVDVEPQKGTFISRIRLRDVSEAAFLHRALEVEAVRAIATGIDPATLDRLRRSIDRQVAAFDAGDRESFFVLDRGFHNALLDRLAMRRVAEVVDISRAPLERARRLLVPWRKRVRASIEEHRVIVAALAKRDPRAAGDAMAVHIDRGIAELRRIAAEHPDLFDD